MSAANESHASSGARESASGRTAMIACSGRSRSSATRNCAACDGARKQETGPTRSSRRIISAAARRGREQPVNHFPSRSRNVRARSRAKIHSTSCGSSPICNVGWVARSRRGFRQRWTLPARKRGSVSMRNRRKLRSSGLLSDERDAMLHKIAADRSAFSPAPTRGPLRDRPRVGAGAKRGKAPIDMRHDCPAESCR